MPNPKVVPATKKKNSMSKRRKGSLAQPTVEDETSQDPSSPDQQPSDSDSTYINEDGELAIEKVQKRMKDVQQTLESNKKVAGNFQDHVLSRKEEISKNIEQHRKQMDDDRIKFQKVMYCATVSALLPMSISQDSKMNSDDEDEPANTKISMLAVQRTNVELFKRTAKICEATADLLTLYSGLKKLGMSGERIVKTRQDFQIDKELARRMITAGAMKAKLQVQAMLASRSISTQLSAGMSKEEVMNAKRFEGQGEVDANSSEQHGIHWNMFTRTLTDNVRKIEKLVEHE